MTTPSTTAVTTAPLQLAPEAIDQQAVLKHLGLNPRDPSTQALLLTCQRYGLDPLLKHAVLISGRLYVTRDGLLHVAHRSGRFDGMEVLEQGETATHHTAKVSVWRKDMGRPFTYIGRHPKDKRGPAAAYGPEMAVKCAEVMALRRAFDVSLCAAEEIWDAETAETSAPSQAAKPSLVSQPSRELSLAVSRCGDMVARVRAISPEAAAEVEQILEAHPNHSTNKDAADACYEALKEAGLKHYAAKQTETQEVAVAAVELATSEQRQSLALHAKRAGATSIEQRSKLWGYLLNRQPVRTTELTKDQAANLLEQCGGMANDALTQCLLEALEAAVAEVLN